MFQFLVSTGSVPFHHPKHTEFQHGGAIGLPQQVLVFPALVKGRVIRSLPWDHICTTAKHKLVFYLSVRAIKWFLVPGRGIFCLRRWIMLWVPCCKAPSPLCSSKRDSFICATFHITARAWEQPWTGLECGIIGAINQQGSGVGEESSGQALKKNQRGRNGEMEALQGELTAGYF